MPSVPVIPDVIPNTNIVPVDLVDRDIIFTRSSVISDVDVIPIATAGPIDNIGAISIPGPITDSRAVTIPRAITVSRTVTNYWGFTTARSVHNIRTISDFRTIAASGSIS